MPEPRGRAPSEPTPVKTRKSRGKLLVGSALGAASLFSFAIGKAAGGDSTATAAAPTPEPVTITKTVQAPAPAPVTVTAPAPAPVTVTAAPPAHCHVPPETWLPIKLAPGQTTPRRTASTAPAAPAAPAEPAEAKTMGGQDMTYWEVTGQDNDIIENGPDTIAVVNDGYTLTLQGCATTWVKV